MTPLELAKLSASAYDDTPTVSVKGVEVVVTAHNGGTVLAFRGTESNYGDILTDLRGVPWRAGELGWCHSGFLKCSRKAWPLIKSTIDALALPRWSAPIVVTGHSKGGADGTIVAAIAVLLGYRVTELVTFGSPRVGFEQLGRVLEGVEVKRYVRGRDAIPTHPMEFWGYRHVGPEIAIGTPAHRYEDHQIAGYVDALAALGGERAAP